MRSPLACERVEALASLGSAPARGLGVHREVTPCSLKVRVQSLSLEAFGVDAELPRGLLPVRSESGDVLLGVGDERVGGGGLQGGAPCADLQVSGLGHHVDELGGGRIIVAGVDKVGGRVRVNAVAWKNAFKDGAIRRF